MKKRWRIFALIFLLTLAGALLLIQKLPQLLEQRIGKELAPYDVTEFHLGQPFFGLRGSGTNRLQFSGNYEDWQYKITADQVLADYHWRALLKGDIHGVSLQNLRVELVQKPLSAKSQTPLDFSALLAQLSGVVLPVAIVSVETISGALKLPGNTVNFSGDNISLDGQNKTLQGDLSLQLKDQSFVFKANVKPGANFPWIPDLSLRILQNDDELLSANGQLVPGETDQDLAIRLSTNLQFQNMPGLLAAAQITPDISRADLYLNGVLGFPTMIDISNENWLSSITFDGQASGALMLASLTDKLPEPAEIRFDLSLTKTDNLLLVQTQQPVTAQTTVSLKNLPDLEEALGIKSPLNIAITAESPEPLSIDVMGDNLQHISGSNWKAQLRSSEKSLAADIRVAEIHFDSTLTARLAANIKVPYQGKPLPQIAINTDISRSSELLQIKGDYQIPAWKITGNLSSRMIDMSSVSASVKASFTDLPLVLEQSKQWLNDLPDIKLASGQGTVKLDWRLPANAKQSSQTFEVAAKNISGIVDGASMVDATMNTTLHKQQTWQTRKPVKISIPQLSSGVLLEKIHINIDLLPSTLIENSHWRLNEISASVFSGTLNLKETTAIQFPLSGNRLQFQLSNISLLELLKLYEAQGISGTGILSGVIPMVLEEDGIRIDNGLLRNLKSGTLRFSSDKSAALQTSSPQLAMTMRLLENFNYELLQASAKFEPSGVLLLGVKLSGNNPAEFDGRQVNFNINVEENLFDLLKVLRLTDEITQKLEKRIESGQ